jgi:hypothetical protein
LDDIHFLERFGMKREPRRRPPSRSRRAAKQPAPPPAERLPAEIGGTQFDRFLARLNPPTYVLMLIILGLALSTVLIFLPGLAGRIQLDSLAFGITLCWIPIGIVSLVVGALRAQDNARRAWGWLGTALLLGLGVTLFLDMMRMRGDASGPRFLMFVICTPMIMPPLIPALIFLIKVWREAAQVGSR